jgi:hypothetical protein
LLTIVTLFLICTVFLLCSELALAFRILIGVANILLLLPLICWLHHYGVFLLSRFQNREASLLLAQGANSISGSPASATLCLCTTLCPKVENLTRVVSVVATVHLYRFSYSQREPTASSYFPTRSLIPVAPAGSSETTRELLLVI